MYNNQLTLQLLTENGNPITEFSQNGLTFVEGRKGSKYKIKITNGTYSQIKAVISVDGLDILTGKRAKANAGGYVIPAYGSEVLDGWRISDKDVREFFFTKAGNSYNAKTGNDTNNLGVIGVLAYKEYVEPRREWPYKLLSGHYSNPITNVPFILNSYGSFGSMNYTAETLKSMRAVAKSSSVGTGMGEVKHSPVQTVSKVFESTPFATCLIYYKTRKELEAMGITVAPVKDKPLPSAFEGYCRQV